MGTPDPRMVDSEISGSAARNSSHSVSPITLQPRDATKSSTCFFLMPHFLCPPRPLVLRHGGGVLHERFGKIVPARPVGFGDEVEVMGLRRSQRRSDRTQTRI